MNRLEKFRGIRNYRRKLFSSFFLFFFLLISGICITDSSVNGLMKNENSVRIIYVNSKDSSIEINFMSRKVLINTTYISSDLSRFKNMIDNLLSHK